MRDERVSKGHGVTWGHSGSREAVWGQGGHLGIARVTQVGGHEMSYGGHTVPGESEVMHVSHPEG